jgi:calcineurin-like phosphoesterase family protein
MSTDFFTSDNHFGHTNVIDYCGRPFVTEDGQPDLSAMHETMIARWNARVGAGDTVFHLGDFSFQNVGHVRAVRQRLNGRIVLIRGNHDRSKQSMLHAGFDEVHNALEIERDGLKLYLAHIPLLAMKPTDDHKRRYKPEFTPKPPDAFDYFICGHVHEKWRRRGKVINAGVDQWSFRPVTLGDLLAAEES